jgi:hypothetical protein
VVCGGERIINLKTFPALRLFGVFIFAVFHQSFLKKICRNARTGIYLKLPYILTFYFLLLLLTFDQRTLDKTVSCLQNQS